MAKETEEEKKARIKTEKQDDKNLAERARIEEARKKKEMKDENERLKKELADKEDADKDTPKEAEGAGIVTEKTETQADRDNADWKEIAIVMESHWQRLGEAPADTTDRERELRTAHIAKYKRLASLARKQIK